MDTRAIKSVIEGLLFASGDEGLEAKQLAEVVEMEVSAVKDLLQDMKTEWVKQHRGIQIVEMAGHYQMTTLPAHAPFFQKLAYSPSRGSLSQAALETLAIIVYRQPITRIEIEEIRGVKSDRAIYTLTAKELIHPVGRAEAVGRPILYGTTKLFLDYFGLNSLKDLPDSSHFENFDNLEEETRQLFEKLEDRQITIEELEET